MYNFVLINNVYCFEILLNYLLLARIIPGILLVLVEKIIPV